MPRMPEKGRPKEQQPLPYYLAARFPTREAAAVPYYAAQETLRTHPCDLSAYRFLRQWEEPNDNPWYVLVLGRTPKPAIQERLTEALRSGELTTVPDQVLLELAARRRAQQHHGSWVE